MLDELPVLQSMLDPKGVGPNTGDRMPHLQERGQADAQKSFVFPCSLM